MSTETTGTPIRITDRQVKFLLIGCGAVLVFAALAGVAVGAVLLFASSPSVSSGSGATSSPGTSSLIVGKWGDVKQAYVTVEFRSDRTAVLRAGEGVVKASYEVQSDGRVLVTFEPAARVRPWMLTPSFSEGGRVMVTIDEQGVTKTWRKIR